MTQLGSILLASTDPQRLRDWYAAALEPDVDNDQEGYRVLGFGGFYVMIDTRDDIGPANPEPGRIILNFHVRDAQAVVDRLEQLGATWIAKLDDRDGSRFATVADPDGNYVQVIELSEAHLAEMGVGS
ncbi:MAG: VOC family protein [Actinomycetota bacterium]|nr:VOC family protein [Actinomycetota bacterium]